MTLPTDSEQKLLLAELCNTTQTKVEAVLRKFRLDRVPDDIEKMRNENAKQRSKGRGLWQAAWHAVGVLKAEGDKLFKD